MNGHWRCDSMELVWNGSWNGWNEVWNRIQKWRDPKSDADADAMRGGRWFFLPPITIWCGCTSGGVPKEITPSSSDLGRFDPVHLRSCLQDGVDPDVNGTA